MLTTTHILYFKRDLLFILEMTFIQHEDYLKREWFDMQFYSVHWLNKRSIWAIKRICLCILKIHVWGFKLVFYFILRTETVIKTFLKKSFLVLMQITDIDYPIDLCKQIIVKNVCLICNVVYWLILLNFVVKNSLKISYHYPFPLLNKNKLN